MSQATLRQRLAAGERAFGTMAFEFFTPGLAPVLHAAGCEWVVLDTEHSGAGIETIKQQIAYARGLDLAVWVRVPEKSYAAVATVLDAGARGIMVPMLETVEQAQDLVRWARYRPDGERGCAFGVAHDGYGAADAAATMRAVNEQIVLIETVQGIERCEEIMAVPGLDVGWLGHYDLTNDMGITAQFDDPRFVASAERLAKACAAAGKAAGTLDANLAYVTCGRRWRAATACSALLPTWWPCALPTSRALRPCARPDDAGRVADGAGSRGDGVRARCLRPRSWAIAGPCPRARQPRLRALHRRGRRAAHRDGGRRRPVRRLPV